MADVNEETRLREELARLQVAYEGCAEHNREHIAQRDAAIARATAAERERDEARAELARNKEREDCLLSDSYACEREQRTRATAAESALAEARGALERVAAEMERRASEHERKSKQTVDAGARGVLAGASLAYSFAAEHIRAALARAGEQETPLRESRPCTCGRTPMVHRHLDGTITIHCACGLHLLVNPAPQPAGEPASGGQDVPAADCIALVEGWWRRKCGALQRTHAPNLGSARVDATEVEELLRKMRSLAAPPPGEQGNDSPKEEAHGTEAIRDDRLAVHEADRGVQAGPVHGDSGGGTADPAAECESGVAGARGRDGLPLGHGAAGGRRPQALHGGDEVAPGEQGKGADTSLVIRSHLNWIIGWAQTAGSETLLANARRALEALTEQGKGGGEGLECGQVGERWVCVKPPWHAGLHAYELRPAPAEPQDGK